MLFSIVVKDDCEAFNDEVEKDTIEEAFQYAEKNVRRDYQDFEWANYDVEIAIWPKHLGDDGEDDAESRIIRIYPPEPDCINDEQKHKWGNPYEVVGGIKENPGVWGLGSSVRTLKVCRHCGAYKQTDHWDFVKNCEDTKGKITYNPPDKKSEDWVNKNIRTFFHFYTGNSHDPQEEFTKMKKDFELYGIELGISAKPKGFYLKTSYGKIHFENFEKIAACHRFMNILKP